MDIFSLFRKKKSIPESKPTTDNQEIDNLGIDNSAIEGKSNLPVTDYLKSPRTASQSKHNICIDCEKYNHGCPYGENQFAIACNYFKSKGEK